MELITGIVEPALQRWARQARRMCKPGRKIMSLSLNILMFPHSSVGKESASNAGDLGSIPGSEGTPGEGNGNPL